MLTLYRRHRRHLAKCDHAKVSKPRGTPAAEKDSCKCPIWLQGTHEGEPVRKSLDTGSWAAAEKLKRGIEEGKQVEIVKREVITLARL